MRPVGSALVGLLTAAACVSAVRAAGAIGRDLVACAGTAGHDGTGRGRTRAGRAGLCRALPNRARWTVRRVPGPSGRTRVRSPPCVASAAARARLGGLGGGLRLGGLRLGGRGTGGSGRAHHAQRRVQRGADDAANRGRDGRAVTGRAQLADHRCECGADLRGGVRRLATAGRRARRGRRRGRRCGCGFALQFGFHRVDHRLELRDQCFQLLHGRGVRGGLVVGRGVLADRAAPRRCC